MSQLMSHKFSDLHNFYGILIHWNNNNCKWNMYFNLIPF